MAAGDFTIPDTTGTATELTTLFGVAQGVGDTPVFLSSPTTETVPGGFGPGTGPGGPGTRGPSTTQTVPGKKSTVTQTLQGFYGLGQAELEGLQRQLYAAGFFSSSYYGKTPRTPQFGTPDDDSFAAFKSAVVQAARGGKPLPDVISAAMKSTAAGFGPGAPGQTTPTKLTSPTDIRAVVVAGARQTYGHKVDEAMVHDIISRYQALEAQAQESTAATVTQPPDLSSFVGQQLQNANPTEAALNNAGHAAALVMQAFSGGSGG